MIALEASEPFLRKRIAEPQKSSWIVRGTEVPEFENLTHVQIFILLTLHACFHEDQG